MTNQIETLINEYNQNGKGITRVITETLKNGKYMNVKVSEPWKVMSGTVVGTFRIDDFDGIKTFLEARTDESKKYIEAA